MPELHVLSPRESGEYVAQTSQDVKVCWDGVKKIVDKMYPLVKRKEYGNKNWKEHPMHPSEMNEATIDWIFMVDTLNFSFWAHSEEEKCRVRCRGQEYTGYFSLCAAVNRALDEGIPITTPSYYANITMDDFKHVFRSDSKNDFPLLEERYKHLRETGKILVEKYNGSFVNCIPQCEKSAVKLYNFVASTFPSFRDVVSYQGKTVSLMKRAQITVANLWSCFEGQSYGTFHDIDELTMFADYRVPQALVYFGALQYSDSLMAKLKASTLFTPGERQEVEIRGCSIWAVELVSEEVKRRLQEDPDANDTEECNSIIVDYFLWDYAQAHRKDMEHIPIHKIRTIYY
ncbi:queuosine 5'-phosphate N-glycosylase/hydrolase-like [Ptychodera flava]|uniref:queuosine 5'-phosphate N-glycosylase/hydrolase-like n=1 Tax=Ptychodera flava TaxID=63121 RepID=UPI00396A9B68